MCDSQVHHSGQVVPAVYCSGMYNLAGYDTCMTHALRTTFNFRGPEWLSLLEKGGDNN